MHLIAGISENLFGKKKFCSQKRLVSEDNYILSQQIKRKAAAKQLIQFQISNQEKCLQPSTFCFEIGIDN